MEKEEFLNKMQSEGLKLPAKLSPNAKRILHELSFYDEGDTFFFYYKSLFRLSIQDDADEKFHPGFIEILKLLCEDEIYFLKQLRAQTFEFVETFDYVKGKGFYNRQYTKFDFPKSELKSPEQFWNYVLRLQDSLQLINWPIYHKEPIIDNGIQTGAFEQSRLQLTPIGTQFISAILLE
jgi:hypothetical protein